MNYSLAFLSFFLSFGIMAQVEQNEQLPYAEIPAFPETYTAGTVVSRMIDGLGFRYYWATMDLRKEDLYYKASEDSRTIGELIDHIYSLSTVVYNTALRKENDKTTVQNEEDLSTEDKRRTTLMQLKAASAIFKAAVDLNDYKVVFKNPNGTSSFPFWNQINGPIEDAVWHTGQIVILRRAAGNPLPVGVNVFLGSRKGSE
jgi:hypothetical protein